MGAAWIIAAIGFGAAAFMLWFLIAVLREGAPSVCYWVVPVRGKLRMSVVKVASGTSFGDEQCSVACNLSDYHAELLEYKNHEKGKYGSGLITLDVRICSASLDLGAIRSRGSRILRERRPGFE